jgi:hypothetical protein
MVNDLTVQNEITRWEALVRADKELLELAFFKIFVKFEKFLADSFIIYAIGGASKTGFVPQRKLPFVDEAHLRNVIMADDKKYSDLPIERVKILSENIFENGQNPFFRTLSDSVFTPNFKEMQLVRHFIAHESDESQKRYIDRVLQGYGKNEFIPLIDFFQLTKRFSETTTITKTLSIYSIYTLLLSKHAELIANYSV